MSALETSIDNLTAEHTALTEKLEQIDQQYRVERPMVVAQIGQLAKALSALTGKPVAGAAGQAGRKPMSEAGKAAIKAGPEKARAAKMASQESANPAATEAPAEASSAPETPVFSETERSQMPKSARSAERSSNRGR